MEASTNPALAGQPRTVAPRALSQAYGHLVQNLNAQAARAQGMAILPAVSGSASAEEQREMAAASARTVAAIASTKRTAGEVAAILGKLMQLGRHESEAYLSMAAAYKKLTQGIQEAERQYKAWQEEKMAALAPAVGTGPPGADLSGVVPIKGTLGPASQPGMTSLGPEVLNLQKLLQAIGFPVAASGAFDAQTRAAVLRFQTERQLQLTGVVGAETRRVFNEMLPRQAAQ